MPATTSTVTIHFTKGDNEFSKTFSKCLSTNLATKEDAKDLFVDKYKGIVDGTATTYDFALVEAGIEL